MKNLNIITNERIFYYENNFFSENIDCSSIVEGLSKNFTIKVFARSSYKIEKNLILQKKNIYLSNNIFTFIKNIILSGNFNNSYNLVISITPYTFLAFFVINFFLKKKFTFIFVVTDLKSMKLFWEKNLKFYIN